MLVCTLRGAVIPSTRPGADGGTRVSVGKESSYPGAPCRPVRQLWRTQAIGKVTDTENPPSSSERPNCISASYDDAMSPAIASPRP